MQLLALFASAPDTHSAPSVMNCSLQTFAFGGKRTIYYVIWEESSMTFFISTFIIELEPQVHETPNLSADVMRPRPDGQCNSAARRVTLFISACGRFFSTKKRALALFFCFIYSPAVLLYSLIAPISERRTFSTKIPRE